MDVTIVCGEEALRLFETIYAGSDFLPEKKSYGEFWLLEWWDVYWDAGFEVVSRIESVLDQLDSGATRNKGLAYKQFIFGEDETDIWVRSNVIGFEELSDFCVQRKVVFLGECDSEEEKNTDTLTD